MPNRSSTQGALPAHQEPFSPRPMTPHSFKPNPSAHAGHVERESRPLSQGTRHDYSKNGDKDVNR